MLNKFSFIGGRRGQHGALGIATPRRRGKEAPPQDIVSEESEETSSSEDADPNYLALFVPLLTMHHVHGKSLSGPVHKWLIVLFYLHLNYRIM